MNDSVFDAGPNVREQERGKVPDSRMCGAGELVDLERNSEPELIADVQGRALLLSDIAGKA